MVTTNPNEIITAKNVTTDLFPPKKDTTDDRVNEIFPKGGPDAVRTLSPDEKLAEYVGQETLGEAGLEDTSVRGDIAAGDTREEKLNAFRNAYPDGDLIFVPPSGKAGVFTGENITQQAQSILEQVPTDKKHGVILFRKDKSEQYAKLDADMWSKGGNEILADFYEFFSDDLGTLTGEIAAGSKKFLSLINKIPGAKVAKKLIPGLSQITTVEDAYSLLPLLTRTGLFSFAGEIAQESVQELRGINEQGVKQIASSAGFKSIIATGGTAVLEPVVRRIANVFKGAGLLTRSDESTQGILAVTELNSIFKELNITDKNGKILKIKELPSNVLIEPGILTKIASQSAAVGGPLSKSYQQINEALTTALAQVGDAKSAGNLIDLLTMATQFEKNRLLDLSHQAMNGSLKFDTLGKDQVEYLLKQSGVENLSDLTMKDAAQIIKESMETMTQPGGYLDNNIKLATEHLISLKPAGVQLDLGNLITAGKKINFGIVQAKKEINGRINADSLEDWILTDFGTERLAIVNNNIENRFAKLGEDAQTPEAFEKIRHSEYSSWLKNKIGSDPLINMSATGSVIENISKALRDMKPEGGSIQIPEGALQATGTGETSTLDFLFEQRRQLLDILNAGPSNVSRQQKLHAKELLNEINSTIKGAANGDEVWGSAFNSLLETEAKALSMRKLPIIQGLAENGKYKELVKGYMDTNFSVADIGILKNTMDDTAWDAFRAGFFNELVGVRNTPGSLDNLLNLQNTLGKYDRKVLEAIFDRPTLTALDNIGGYMKKLDNSGIRKTLADQSQVGPAIRELINQKETKKISEVLDLIKNHSDEVNGQTVTGWDTPLGQSVHNAIKNELFKFSTTKVKGKPKLNLEKYRKFVDNLKESGIWDTLPKKERTLLEKTDLVKDFIVQGGDVGTSLEIAALAESGRGIVTGRTSLGTFAGQMLELLGIGNIFTSKAGRFLLTGIGKDQIKPATVSRVFGGIGATLLAPDDGSMDDLKFILDIGKSAANVVLPKSMEFNNDEQASIMAPTPDVSFTPNPNSRLAGAFNPAAGMTAPQATNTGTGTTNQATADRGRQIFGQNDPIFAAQGGIMNAHKQIQRVA
jgi:hypothetical protein